MTEADIFAFGIEIVYKQLEADGWAIESADVEADRSSEPQITAHKDGELAFFVVRTGVYPARGTDLGKARKHSIPLCSMHMLTEHHAISPASVLQIAKRKQMKKWRFRSKASDSTCNLTA